jgi:putative transposase
MSRGAYKQYSYEVKRAIFESGNVGLYPGLKIPKSTAYQWMRHGIGNPLATEEPALTKENQIFAQIRALLEILSHTIDITDITEDQAKTFKNLLSDKRLYAEWLPKNLEGKLGKRVFSCEKSESGSCLRRYPGQLTREEVGKMRSMVQDEKYAHLPICSLALLAKRQGRVNCGVHTWYKYVAANRWKRPFKQVTNKRRYHGLKAKHPHEYWHQDVTKIPFASGHLACLQVIQDNCSRAILGWKISKGVKALDSAKLLERVKSDLAGCGIRHVHLITDGGSENVGANARKGFSVGLPRVIGRVARREIRYANTMVEVFFKSLKSNYLRGKNFESMENLMTAVNFYIDQYNNVIPKVALNGLTPAEVLSGVTISDVFGSANHAKAEAKLQRISLNKSSGCSRCP